MDMQQLDRLTYSLDIMFCPDEDRQVEQDENKLALFDVREFIKNYKLYEQVVKRNSQTVFKAAKSNNIPYEQFLNEIHVYAALNPGRVSIRYLSGYFRSALTKQKEIDAICYMREHYKKLSVELICERLNVSEQNAIRIVQNHNLDVQITPKIRKELPITYHDVINNEAYQSPIIKFFNANPNLSVKACIKALGLNISEMALKNAIENLLERGYKIPCRTYFDPLLEEQQMAEIVAYKEKNFYHTPAMIAKKFNVSEHKINSILNIASEQYRVEKLRSYEFIFKNVIDEIDEIGDLCMDRFKASPASSSRWLEIKQMGIEKKIRMLGLNSPMELRVQQNVTVESKEEKDAIIDAFMATNLIDVTNSCEVVNE